MEALASTGSGTKFAQAQMFYVDTAALLRFLQPQGWPPRNHSDGHTPTTCSGESRARGAGRPTRSPR